MGDADQLRRKVRDAAAGAPDHVEFRIAVLDAIRAVVPFDAACIATTDPATVMPTSAVAVELNEAEGSQRFAELEYSPDGGDSYAALAGERRGVRALSQTPHHATAPRFVELIAPLGFRDEMRMVFRDAGGACWGFAALMRGPGRRFSAAEVGVLAHSLDAVADGQRAALLRGVVTTGRGPSRGPAVVLIGADGEVESATPQALAYLGQLQPDHVDDSLLTLPVRIAAARSRLGLPVSSRVRLPRGGWLVLQTAQLDGRGRTGRVVVTMEPAQPPEIVTVIAAALGLTHRETEVFEHVLTGRTSIDIGRRLFISPHTVQDHLKKIFMKAGVNSRKQLVALVFYSQYAPRLGQPVAPNGWFTD